MTEKLKTDTVLKEFWRNNDRFADLFNTVLFHGRQVVRPEELVEQDSDVSMTFEINSYTKTLERMRDVIRKSNGKLDFVILGIENQTKIHYAMPLRVMLYDGLSYLKEFDEIVKYNRKDSFQNTALDTKENDRKISSAEFLSGFRKEDRLHPVITLVIYYGEEPWDGPHSLEDMLIIPDELKGLVSDYRMTLLDIRKAKNYNFSNEDVKIVFDVIGKFFKQEYEAVKNSYKGKQISSEVVKVISAILHTEDLWKAFTIEEKGEKSMVKALEELINRGKEEERRTIIRSMIQNGLGEEEIMKYTGSTMELVVQVRESL